MRPRIRPHTARRLPLQSIVAHREPPRSRRSRCPRLRAGSCLASNGPRCRRSNRPEARGAPRRSWRPYCGALHRLAAIPRASGCGAPSHGPRRTPRELAARAPEFSGEFSGKSRGRCTRARPPGNKRPGGRVAEAAARLGGVREENELRAASFFLRELLRAPARHRARRRRSALRASRRVRTAARTDRRTPARGGRSRAARDPRKTAPRRPRRSGRSGFA